MKRIIVVAAGVLLALPCGFAQQAEAGAKINAELDRLISTSKVIAVQGVAMGAVAGAPYSGEEVTTFSQTLGDGTKIQRETKVQVYRDSEGRVRRETPDNITIMDPVAGSSYSLDPKAKTGQKLTFSVINRKDGSTGPTISHSEATPFGPRTGITVTTAGGAASSPFAARKAEVNENVVFVTHAAEGMPVPPPPPPPPAVQHSQAATAGPNGPVATISHSTAEGQQPVFFYKSEVISHSAAKPEQLAAQAIEGVLSEGTRLTETIAPGAIGNDRQIQVVTERWYSPELKTVMMSRRTDPRNGDETFKLTNVSRNEPAANLFQVPAGYQIAGK